MKILSAVAVFLCLAGCNSYKPVISAAENGFRQDMKAAVEVINFRELATEKKEAAGGQAALVRFESELKWLTLEEALSRAGAARDTQEYLMKLEYASSRLGEKPKAGGSASVKGAILMAKTDTGWIYKGLAAE